VKGRDFAAQIDAKIREAKAVIALWCTMSVGSEWVLDEAALGLKLGKLVPAKIEPCELRVDFDRKDYVDLMSWSGAPRDHALDPLLDALEHKVGRTPQLDFKAMREFEGDWRRYGALSLRDFALEASVQDDQDLHSSAGSSPFSPSPAERDWDCYRIGETQDMALVKAFIERYGESEPHWEARARERLENLEALANERIRKSISRMKIKLPRTS
jgi:hypothetical protein